MSKPKKADWPPSPQRWAELLDQRGANFLEADSTEKRQEAAAMLLNAVSCMLRHQGLGRSTPEATKALGEIALVLLELAEGLRPKMIEARKRGSGRPPAGFHEMQRRLAVAASVEFLNRSGTKMADARKMVSAIWGGEGFKVSPTTAFNWHVEYSGRLNRHGLEGEDLRAMLDFASLLDQLQAFESRTAGGDGGDLATAAIRNLAQRHR